MMNYLHPKREKKNASQIEECFLLASLFMLKIKCLPFVSFNKIHFSPRVNISTILSFDAFILIEIYYLYEKYIRYVTCFFFSSCVLYLLFFSNIHRFSHTYIYIHIYTPVIFVSYCLDVMHSSMNR